MFSSGIQLGTWEFLQWKHVIPVIEENGEKNCFCQAPCLCRDIEEYYTFIAVEAYNVLKEWMDFCASYREKITRESWSMHDLWQITNMNYGGKWGLATNPKMLKHSGKDIGTSTLGTRNS